jgi:nucleoside-diphosphate-sugar epimerase
LEELLPDLRTVVLDLGDRDAVQRAVAEVAPQWVFHLAAHGAYSWQTDRVEMVRTNLLGTINLLDAAAAAGFEAFVHAGSSSEYGFKDRAPAEDEALEPNSDYAVTKAAATHFCRHAARSREVRAVTLRLYSVYGPWEEPNRLVPTLVSHALRGQLPPLASPGIARDYVHVDDVCEAFLLAATRTDAPPDGIYNVGTGKQTTLAEIVDVARRLFDLAEEPAWGGLADRAWDTSVWISDPRRIEAELGWRPRVHLEEGLRRTAEWLNCSESAWERYGLSDAPEGSVRRRGNS